MPYIPTFRPRKYLEHPSKCPRFVRVIVVTDGIGYEPLVAVLVACTEEDYMNGRHVLAALQTAQAEANIEGEFIVWDEATAPRSILDDLFPNYDADKPGVVSENVLFVDLEPMPPVDKRD